MDARLKLLTPRDGRDIYEMLQEIPPQENGFVSACHGKSFEEYRAWLDRCDRVSHGEGLEEWMVPQTTYFLYVDGNPVGYGKLRHRLTEKLRKEGGHIGYAIRPTERGRGYGKLILSLLLDRAKEIGIGEALVTIHSDNRRSLNAALDNGGRVEQSADGRHYVWIPTDLTGRLNAALTARGASLFGVGDLREIPEDARGGYPLGIVIGLKWDKDVLRGIADGPTHAYHAHYKAMNAKLDALDTYAQDWLTRRGFGALGKTLDVVGREEGNYATPLPHKTVATRAGVGFIGKCALLVTPEFGSGLRISTVLTDAPLSAGEPVNHSRCGDCAVCRQICPAGAVSGTPWRVGLERDQFFNAQACRDEARARGKRCIGTEITLCGLCILHCPWTQRYLKDDAL